MLKNLLLLSGFSAFVVVVIVGLNIYRNLTMSTLRTGTQDKIVPLTPEFDTQTLNGLKKRIPVTVDLFESSPIISEESTRTNPQDPSTIPNPDSSTASPSAATPTIEP